MPMSSNRSPSPLSRSQETGNNGFMRKSFNGNPLTKPSRSFNPATPANSPAEFSRRNFGGKEGIGSLRGSREFKENERDQKKVKEGGETKGGTTKSFMAPTISAISKISPSPRKKVLSERNEIVEEEEVGIASKVISEPKIHSFKPKSLEFQEVVTSLIPESVQHTDATPKASSEVCVKPHVVQKPKSLEFQEVDAPLIPESVQDVDVSSKASNSNPPPRVVYKPKSLEFQEVDASLIPESVQDIDAPPKASNSNSPPHVVHKPPASPSPSLAPIDTDPFAQTRDSETNGVSSSCLKAKLCSSPSTTMAPLDSDPHLPPYDPKTNYLSPRPQFLHYKPKPRIEVLLEKGGSDSEGKKLEDSFTSESNSDTENTEETLSSLGSENDSSSSELLPVEDNQVLEGDYTQLNVCPKSNSRSFMRAKVVPFLLVFSIACLLFPLIDTPDLSPPTYKDQTSFKLAGLASNVKIWSNKIQSYVSTLISNPRGVVVQEFIPLHYSNSTILNEESLGYNVHQFKEDIYREMEDEFDMGVAMSREVEELSEEEFLAVEEVDRVVSEEYSSTIEPEEQPALMLEGPELKPDNVQAHTNSEMINVQESPVPQSSEFPESELYTSDPIETVEPEPDVILHFAESDVPHQGTENAPDEQELVVEEQKSAVLNMENLSTVQKLVGVVSAVFAMVVATVYWHLKLRKTTTTTEAGMQKKMVYNGDNDHNEDRFSSRPTEVEMFGDSGPSEMSSSKRSLSYGLRGSERMNEAQSNEKRPRYSKRESLATSSEYSYGSFTTFEKVHTKHGYGEEEVVTPVRRSSRIRKIVSPTS